MVETWTDRRSERPRLVIADDEPVVRSAICAQLRGTFAVVGEAGDAESAIILARDHRPDIALIDVEMPGGGLHATRSIRSESPDTAVVILSGDAGRSSVLRFLDAGAVAYLRKGSSSARLVERLGQAMLAHAHADKRVQRVRPGADERFRAAFDQAGVAMAIMPLAGEHAGRLTFVNAAYSRLVGWHSDELVGRNSESWTHPDDLPEGIQDPLTALATGRAERIEFETRYVHRDGGILFATVSAASFYDEDGQPAAIVQVLDVSERKRSEAQRNRAEEALRKTAERFRALVESAPNAIVIVDQAGKMVVVNTQAELMFGYSRAELLGQPVEILVPGGAREGHRRHRDEFIAAPRKRLMGDGLELVARRSDGSEFPVEIGLSPLQTDEGVLISCAISDITDRKQASDALAEAEDRFRGAFEGAPIGMALVDPGGRFVRVNEALCRITGYPSEELEGMGTDEIMRPEDRGDIYDELVAVRDNRQTLYATEKRVVHASGHSVWVALQVTLIRGRPGPTPPFLVQIQDITDRKRYEDTLQDLADHDALTGLLNRRSFGRLLDAQVALVSRYGTEGALLMLDLDHFKYVNDALGHQAGDELIIRVAQIMAGRLRDSDVVARLGGDEFAILLPKADAKAAAHTASQVLQALAIEPIIVDGAPSRATTASIGIATFEPELTGEELLVNADLAMYDAKDAGRNRFAIYRSEQAVEPRTRTRVNWAQRIRTALDHDGFRLLAQPIVDYRTGRPSQYELLLRMTDQDGGELTSPGTFLYIAERLDMIQEVDAWVARNAIELLARNSGSGGNLPLNVNLSGRSLGDPNLLELIEHELHRTGVTPRRLIFEITETAAVKHTTHAQRFSERLAELGCSLALDDFGAGFGSFYYLKHVPFDFIKIDGEFVRNCTNSKTDRLVIEAVVGLARGLGKKTIAEFVGDDETVRLLTRLGVDYGQGYHHGRPGPVDAFIPAVGPKP